MDAVRHLPGSEAPAADPTVGAGRAATLHERVGAQAAATPGAAAVVHDGVVLTYAELDERSTRLAHELRALGVRAETPVAVMLERDPELVVALLGVLKAGGAFVPVDPAYPAARIQHMVDDSGARAVLLREHLRDRLPIGLRGGTGTVAVIPVDGTGERFAHHPLTPVEGAARPEHLAYLVYTSGSTGLPKGVMVEHRGIVSYLLGMLEHFPMGPRDRMLQVTSLSFDVSVYEIFLPLLTGGATVLPLSGSHTDPRYLSALIAEHGVTSFHMVPSLLRTFVDGLDPEQCAGLRRIFVSGEALGPALVTDVHDRLPCDLVNLYGATEVSVDSTWWTAPRDRPAAPVLVGRPMSNATSYVLDDEMRQLTGGEVGEVYLGGASVTRGYHGRAALTAQRFPPDPFGPPGSRLYRTGDLGRWEGGGELRLLGRIDHQVKLHGRRIEPGEIETEMTAHPQVGTAAVIAVGSGAQAALTGFFTGRGAGPEELRAFLGQRLPAGLVPARLVELDTLPLSPNGKLDRNALAELAAGDLARLASSSPARPAEPASRPARSDAPDTVPPHPDLLLRTVLDAMADVLGGIPITSDENFFGMGGNSLHATRLVAKLRVAVHPGIGVREVFEHQTPAQLAEALRPTLTDAVEKGAGITGTDELSSAQHRMWLLAQISETPAEYAITLALHLRGALEVEALDRAVDAVVRRHDSLRSCFPQQDGVPVRAETPADELRMRHAPPEPGGDPDAVLRRVVREQIAGLDLADGPLFRPVLVRLGAEEHLLVVVLHHIVADGWSTELLLEDIAAHYGADTAGKPRPRRPAVSYQRYVDIERRNERDGVTDRHLEYFTTELHGIPDEVTLPLDRPRPPQRSGRGATLRLEFGRRAAGAVRRLASTHRTTPFVILLAGLSTLLHRTGGHEDVVIGSAVAGRFDAEVDDLVGLCLNSVALRWPVRADVPFSLVVERAEESLLGAMDHSAAPYARVIEKLGVRRDARRTPAFQVIALYDDVPETIELPGLAVRTLETDDGSAQCDALFTFRPPTEHGMALSIEFSTDLFEHATVRRWSEQLETLLTAAADAPGATVARLPLLTDSAHHELLTLGEGRVRPLPDGSTLTGLFARQVALAPERTAVTWRTATGESARLSYAELDERSSRLAHALRELGVGVGVPVAVCLLRGADVLTAVYAVLKAGGGYVPVEADNPPERIAGLVSDSGAHVLLTQRQLAAALADTPADSVLLVDDAATDRFPATAPAPAPRPQDLAYVIYTSGSTGRPKGVMVEHHSVVNYLLTLQETFGLTTEDRLLLKSPLSFDVSVREVFWALSTGATLVVAEPGRHADPAHLVETVERERVTVVHFVPSMLNVLLETLEGTDRCPTLRQVMTSGETLPVATANRCRELLRAELCNMYGPTETTVEMTAFDVRAHSGTERLPIGAPFPNTRVYVLDEALRPVPRGTVGELYVSGDPVARGYLGRPALTADRFLPDPWGPPGARMYRTGDLGRFTAQGLLDFAGRSDHQVQLRGHRIEPGEIESLLCEQPGVSAATAVVRRADTPEAAYLVAYAVRARPPYGTDAGLRGKLAELLPSYMVPTAVITLDALPLTVNGKLDRTALPAPGETGPGERPGRGAPGVARLEGPTETALAGIWQELLGVDEVGPDDNFFGLGGHSLLVATLSARVRDELGVRAPLTLFLLHPVLRELAAALPEPERAGQRRDADGLRPLGGDRAPLSAAQRRIWVEEQLWPGTAAYAVPEAFRLRGPLDERAFEAALHELMSRHDALRGRVEGDDHPEMVVDDRLSARLLRSDLRGQGEAAVSGLLERAGHRVFDLSGPLAETTLARIGEEEWVFLFTAHHLVVDGWSFGLLWRDLEGLYRRHSTGGGLCPAPPRLAFIDYARWESERVAAGSHRAHLDFWRQELAGLPSRAGGPDSGDVAAAGGSGPPDDAGTARAGESRTVPLGAELSGQLRLVAADLGVTPFVLTLTAFAVALAADGPADQVIGVEVAGRTDERVADVVGLFVNHVPLRLRGGPGRSARQTVAAVDESWRRVLEHAEVSFDAIVDELGGRHAADRAPGHDIAFSYLDSRTPLRLDGVRVTPLEPGFGGTAKFGLLLEVFDTPDGLVGVFEYRPGRFGRGRTTRIKNRWEAVLLGLLADLDAPLEPQD
ncbi:amino acid adenylation domain-containing protein [Streptomyces sp. NPDC102283]|uniref:amino acid adenylation domain-containing protein n=1 Tax=Streptomyces sp. NPDC102283 TaxID=3366155 RepID=UPI003825D684